MRYEDASQSGTISSDVMANDDADHLAANDFGPATGNTITGAGTITGATGTDLVSGGTGQIVSILSAGGSDSSYEDGQLQVAGQYGVLTISTDGNYSYVRNPGTPDGVSDVFTYTLAGAAGATDTAKLTINIGDLPMLQAQGTRVVPGTDGVVVLPPGVELSDIRVVGRDLVITLPDGSTMTIVDGAVFVPQLVLGGVEVPASNLAALLIGSEPTPAAGDSSPTQLSSGGNFAVEVPPLDPGVPLGDLLPPTELTFTPPDFEEIQFLEEDDPPVIGSSAVNVSEEGVSAISPPNPDTSGSPDTTNSPTNGGIIPISDPNGDALTVAMGAPSAALTSQGVAITWTVSPDGHLVTGSAGANTVITISIDDTGAYTVNLLRPIDHPTGGGEQGASFVIPVSVSDGDNVTTGGTITVTIEDDSPTISGQFSEPTLVVDETVLATNATASFAGAFDVDFGADGAAASNSLAWALGINAGATGLTDTATGTAVVLSLESGQVVGRAGAGGPIVFTVSVDGSGNVTLDQQRAVVHNDPADPDEPGASAATLAADNLVTLSLIATDRDGDTATTTIGIGQNLSFEDDGPSISNQGAQPTLVVDETVLATNASASFAGAFTPSFGADGPAAANSVSYALGINAGATGVTDTATGLAVVLTVESGVVVGRAGAGGPIVFTVSVDAAGVVTLDQQRAVVHNDPADPDEPGASAVTLAADNLITLTATATDGDGDTASASINIGTNLQLEDDGPSIGAGGAQPTLVVDETVLATNVSASFAGIFTPAFGADGPAAVNSVVYALGINAGATGLTDTATGLAVVLTVEGGAVVGRAGPGGPIVFTVSVDAAGVVTLDQQRAVVHDDPSDPDESSSPAVLSADNLITLTATVTDGDGDTATATANIGQNLAFEDDGPSISAGGEQPTLVVDETLLGTNASASFAGVFTPAFGADGPAVPTSVTYALGINAGATGLTDTATGLAVVLTVEGGSVVGRAGAGGPIVFTVSVDAAGVVTLDQQRAVVHDDPSDPDEAGSPAVLSADNLITLTATATDKDGDTASATADIGSNLAFEDDGPSASLSTATEPVLIVDETNLASDAGPTSFAGLFTTSFGADGPAAANSLTYSLGINAGATGITDTATGLAVVLTVEGGAVVGRAGAGGPIVFTVSVDAAGSVTLDQQRAVVHDDPTDPDESSSPAILSADNLVTLTVTATDGDGDTATATANIGQNLRFEDDGPSMTGLGPQPTLVVDETVLATNASASFAAAFTPSFGADGPAAVNPTVYTLGINAGATGLTDTATGLAVVLSVEGGAVVGRAGPGGPVVFTVSVDAAGVVTLDQQRAVVHDDPSDPDESSSPAVLSADNLITLTATATDGDGDTASATINIGQNLAFEDDGPSIGAGGTQPTLVVDETVLGTNASASFAGVFTPAFGADGPAAVGSVTYSLGINAGATGITDTATGLAVVLTVEGGAVVGRAGPGGPIVFTVSVDAAGNVTLDQQRAVVHDDPTDPDEAGASAATLAADNLITLTATATDKDGDTATATANIGQNLQFEDDGPSVGNQGTQPNLVVDETILANNASASFAGAFTPSFGADGPAAAGSITYALGINAGATGITDTATGLAVVLTVEAGVVVGRAGAGGPIVFTVSVDAAGVVTLDQQRAVVHNDPADHDEPGASAATLSADNLVTLTATVTDGDGDTASASINIGQNLQFEDDGPSIGAGGAQPTLAVDETVLATNASASFAGIFTPTFGADGPAAANSVTYALGINAGATGITDTATGLAVVLTVEGGAVVGRAGAGGPIVFTVSVDAAGVVTLDQQRAVVHNDPADPDEPGASAVTLAADNLITLTATATDKDGDTASATANIGQNLQFEDDGPSIGAGGTQPTLTVDETVLATNASASFAGVFTPSFGADGPAAANSVTYALGVSSPGVNSGLVDSATGQAVLLTLVGGVVQGRTAVSNDLVFTVSVDSAGVVTLDQIRAIIHTPDTGPDQAATLSADNLITLTATATDKDGDTAAATANIGQNLVFEDDAPSIGAGGTQPTLVVDETILATNASASFAGIFTPTFGADGPAASNSVTYALGINAGATGITDTATGLAVVLTVEAGVVVGRAGAAGPIVFTVSVDAAGVVTLDQQRAVVHNDPADPDEPGLSAVTLAADNLITLTATATDKDGDTASATANIGQNLQFEDDGPVITSVTDPLDIANTGTAPSGTGTFAFSVGADTNSDFDDISVNGFTVTINGSPATNVVLTPDVDGAGNPAPETATTATYRFTFQYDTGSGGLTNASGTLVFNKAAGTYTVTLDSGPIQGFSTLETAAGTDFQGYTFNTSTPDNTQPDIAVTTILEETAPGANDGFYVQFTGFTAGNGSHETIGDGTTNTFVNGDLFSEGTGLDALHNSWVSVSGSANGVGGDQTNDPDALNFNLYSSDPTGLFSGQTGNTPTASASDMFMRFDTISASHDMIVVLKLWSDTNGNGTIDAIGDTFTTKAIVVQAGDIYKFGGSGAGSEEAATAAAVAGTAWEGVVADIIADGGSNNNDGLVIIESNDYNGVGESWQIVGAQVVNSAHGVTGSGTNLDPGVGVAGDSTTAQDVSVVTDGGPLKIMNIGFLAGTTTGQQATIEFDVTVTDGDGDTVVRNDITVNIGAPVSPALLPDAGESEFIAEEQVVSLLAVESEQQLQKTAANSNTTVLAAAVAAAGMAASSAAASDPNVGDPYASESPAIVSVEPYEADYGTEESRGSALTDEAEQAAADEAPAESDAGESADEGNAGELVTEDNAATAPSELLDATDAPAQTNAPAPAADVAMPSAEALVAAGLGGNKIAETVEKIVAEALQGGEAGNPIDAVLNAIPANDNGANPAIEALTSPGQANVSAWDMGAGGGFTADASIFIAMEAAMLHHDAVQPA